MGPNIMSDNTTLYVAFEVTSDSWLPQVTSPFIINPTGEILTGVAGIGAGSSIWNLFNGNLATSTNPITIGV